MCRESGGSEFDRRRPYFWGMVADVVFEGRLNCPIAAIMLSRSLSDSPESVEKREEEDALIIETIRNDPKFMKRFEEVASILEEGESYNTTNFSFKDYIDLHLAFNRVDIIVTRLEGSNYVVSIDDVYDYDSEDLFKNLLEYMEEDIPYDFMNAEGLEDVLEKLEGRFEKLPLVIGASMAADDELTGIITPYDVHYEFNMRL